MPRKRNPEAARIEADYKSKKRSINRQESSARSGQTGRGFGIDKGKYTSNAVGAQEPDPSAHRRKSVDDDRTYQPRTKRVAGEPAKNRISKKKPATEREYDAKKKLKKDKTPQDTPTFNTNKPASKAPKATGAGKRMRKQPTVAAAKPRKRKAGESRPKRPDNWVSAADRDLIENPKKKKRKAPTYRG